MQFSCPASHLLGRIPLLWVELEHLEPTEAELEGEGPAVWEDVLGRCSQPGIPFQPVAPFLSWQRQQTSGICANLPLSLAPQPPLELQNLPEPDEGPTMGLESDPAVLEPEPASQPSNPPHLDHSFSTSPSAPGPALELGPPGPPAGIQIPTTPSPELDSPQAVTTKKQSREEKRHIPTFPPRRVAQQLTLMDVVSSGALRVGWGKPTSAISCPTGLSVI